MKFTLSRRQLLLGTSAGGATLALATWLKVGRSPQAPVDGVLMSIIDAIVPADEFSGAIDIGIGDKFLHLIQVKPVWRERAARIVERCQSLALKQYKRSFDVLDLEQREDLLNSVLGDNRQLIFRIDMLAFRGLIMQWFYRSEPAQQSLNYRLLTAYSNYSNAVR